MIRNMDFFGVQFVWTLLRCTVYNIKLCIESLTYYMRTYMSKSKISKEVLDCSGFLFIFIPLSIRSQLVHLHVVQA
jgi:hypothetical protein